MNGPNSSTRRDFLKRSAALAAAPALTAQGSEQAQTPAASKRPNIVIIIADQFRWDFVGAYGLNPQGVTPNLDAMARRGVAFQNAVTNQPLCSPSRACMFTGLYATQTGVWTLGPGLRPDAVTLATLLRDRGYSANYIGKWHLAANKAHPGQHKNLGYVSPDERGGFLDLWEASNVLEMTSHPYEGTIWAGDGTPIHYKDVYRVDFLTGRGVRFLRQPHDKPFLLVVSQLEPHFQNDANAFIPPKGYAERYANPFVPRDLSFFPGDWMKSLPGYYGDIKKIDESVGTILKTLDEQKLTGNTIVMFISDHGCQFRTRNAEYKRSPHESSIHIPLIMQGPGLDESRMIHELVSMVDVTPTLLDAVGEPAQPSMQGRSALPLIRDPKARAGWRNEAFIQISESMVARALRTDQWTYCVLDRNGSGDRDPSSTHYEEYQLYDNAADPHQLINLAGRRETREISAHLRERLKSRMVDAGEEEPQIDPARFYP